MNKRKSIIFEDLGLIGYRKAWDYQEQVFRETVQHKMAQRDLAHPEPSQQHLLFCEHPPVITLGKSGEEQNLLLNEQALSKQGIEFYKINRGGDITFHGPGQLVGYPILDLDDFYHDIHRYMRDLEEVVIRTIAHFDLKGQRLPGSTGVWLDIDSPSRVRKICAMGVRASRWVTMHGWALNVNTDLNYFNHIIPCGISDKAVTSISQEVGHEINFDEVKQFAKKEFEEVFNCNLVESTISSPQLENPKQLN